MSNSYDACIKATVLMRWLHLVEVEEAGIVPGQHKFRHMAVAKVEAMTLASPPPQCSIVALSAGIYLLLNDAA